MKKVYFYLFVLFISASIINLYAENKIRIAVLDFEMDSANENYTWLGKGFTEFVAVELYKYSDIQLIERDKRNEILKEQAFSLSGFADESKAAEIGKMLTAEYLITGHISDHSNYLVLTAELTDTNTGEIILETKAEGSLIDYNRITVQIGRDIIDALAPDSGYEAAITDTVSSGIGQSDAQAKEVLINFSEAIDAYDNNDLKRAEEKMAAAAELDPNSSAVQFYLGKFTANTSRFKIMPAPYYSRENPAALSLIKNPTLSLYITGGMVETIFGEDWGPDGKKYPIEGLYGPIGNTQFGIRDVNQRLTVDYQTLIGENSGISLGYFASLVETWAQDELTNESYVISQNNNGIAFRFGWSPLSWLALGTGCTIGYSGVSLVNQLENVRVYQFLYSMEGGFLLKNRTNSFIYSFYGGWTSQYYYLSDIINQGPPQLINAPVYADQTITIGLNNNNIFLVSKTIAEFGVTNDIPNYFQPILAIENWFSKTLSVRIGGGYFFTLSGSDISGGFGGNLGSTIVFPKKWEIDLSAAFRIRPTTVGENELIPEIVLNLGIVQLNPFN